MMRTKHFLHLVAPLLVFCFTSCNGSDTPDEKLAAMTRKVAAQFHEVPQLSTADLAAWLADSERKPPLLLDARQPAEYAVSHLPEAIRIDPDTSANQALANIDPARSVVIYCSVGYRSSKLADRLIKSRRSNVMNLEGSIFKWANEGRPLTRGAKPAHKVHPYSSRYARMLLPDLRSRP